jgi:hypothetical protein
MVCLIVVLAVIAALVLAATLAHRENLAAGAVGCSVLFLFALRRPSAVVMMLIPWSVLSTALLHSLVSTVAVAVVLTLAAAVLFSTGFLRIRLTHLWVAVIAVTSLIAYLVPEVRLEPARVPLQEAIWLLAGLAVLAVSVASPQAPLARPRWQG